MFEQSKLTIRDIVIITAVIALRFQLSNEASLALIDSYKICAGPKFINLSLSKYMMAKCFSEQKDTYHVTIFVSIVQRKLFIR